MCKYKKVIKDIMNCPNIKDIYNGAKNDCAEIINFQRDKNVKLEDFKGPEAWNGQLKKSKILVISSNPGIGDEEIIPTMKWKLAKAIDFYQDRFTSKKNWVNNLSGLKKNGTYGNKVQNWTQTKNRIKYLFDEKSEIGTDYTLLELVHCKSANEKGVSRAIKECADRYFEKTMKISPSKVLIITGDIAIDFICVKYSIQKKTANRGYGLYNPISIGGKDRIIIFLPHTNYFGKRKAEYFIDNNDKTQINRFFKQ